MSVNLDGVYAAVVTPFDEEGRIAPEQLQKHLRHIERKGCSGALVGGTTGEAASLSVEERIQVLDAACQAGTHLTLLAGTGAASLEDAVRLTSAAFDLGASAVVVLPPFFLRENPFEGLCLFYEQLLKRAVPGDGRLLLYHNPVTTVTSISFELIRWLRDRFPDQVVGIKDSSSNLEHTLNLSQEFPQFRVFVGDDRLLSASLEAGCAGAITGLANVFPDLLVNVRRSFLEGTPTAAAQDRLSGAQGRLDGLPRVTAIKALLAAGHIIDHPFVRPPLRPLTAPEMATLSERFHLDASVPETVDMAELNNTPEQ